MITLYGIRQCDTCRKALKWFEARGEDVTFHDLRQDGLPREALERWLASANADRLVNRRSTTWRGLGEAERGKADTQPLELLEGHPTLVKRPVVERDGEVLAVGFDAKALGKVLDA